MTLTTALTTDTLVDIFHLAATRDPAAIALETDVERFTYQELDRAAAMLADRLGDLGLGRGDRVGVDIPSGTADLYVAILGILRSGAAYVPVENESDDQRKQLIWEESQVGAILGAGLDIKVRSGGSWHLGTPQPEDDCWIIFTSGSTGTPKGVATSHRSASAFIHAEQALWTILPKDRVFAGLSVAFDASCEEMWSAWSSGATLVACPRATVRAAADLVEWFHRHHITVVSTVPTLAAFWSSTDLTGVRLLILGGEALSEDLAWRLAEGRELWNTYGPTEATVVTTATRVRPGVPFGIGSPLNGWTVAIINERGEEVRDGEVGELVIGGLGLGRYLDAEMDRIRFAPLPSLGWSRAYRSGDLVARRNDEIVYIGRRDDQIKIGGRRVELGEVDAVLASVPGVRLGASTVKVTPSGSAILVCYIVGEVEHDRVAEQLARRLEAGVPIRIATIEEMPRTHAGKIDRKQLPWPLPEGPFDDDDATAREFNELERTVASAWKQHLGAAALSHSSDFFHLGGSSISAAQLVSELRDSYPSLAVLDVYNYRTLAQFTARLEILGGASPQQDLDTVAPPRGLRPMVAQTLQILGVAIGIAITSLPWITALLAYNQWANVGVRVGWPAIAGIWLFTASAPGRVVILAVLRRVLLFDLRPGIYSRYSWFAVRLLFLQQLFDSLHLGQIAGTPWAARYARYMGVKVGRNVTLYTLPSPTDLLRIGSDVTIESNVILRSWVVEGPFVHLRETSIGDGVQISMGATLTPGVTIGAGSILDVGTLLAENAGTHEHWGGSPGRLLAKLSPEIVPSPTGAIGDISGRLRFGFGLGILALLPILAGLPDLLILRFFGSPYHLNQLVLFSVRTAPLLAITYMCTFALLSILIVRSAARWVTLGTHHKGGGADVALWLTEGVQDLARTILFPLYASMLTKFWLRALGVPVGANTEVSTAIGLNRFTSLGDTCFLADLAAMDNVTRRHDQLEITQVSIGNRTFLGNGAFLLPRTRLGDDCLIGVMSNSPISAPDGSTWLGAPPMELPRQKTEVDPQRTISPPLRLKVGRALTETVRIVAPMTISLLLGDLMFNVMEHLRAPGGVIGFLLLAPLVFLATGILATLITVVAKWTVIGRYRTGEFPLWSFFVWRDEIMNSFQEQLAGQWLLNHALGTPLIALYFRAMGARVGKRLWFESIALTEYDLVTLGDDVVMNHHGCVQTHLVHDRLFRTGPSVLDAGVTVGSESAVLLDTHLGAGSVIGPRSLVLRGERIPARSRWHGVPVVHE